MYICTIIESMTFLRPEILTALFLLAIPIIVHLFEFRIFKPTAFTNLLFLEQLKHEQHRYQKLKKWLVLLLRLGYLSGLILAFALPTILSDDFQEQDTPVFVIYVDNSFSTMAKNTSGTTLLSQAKEELYQWSKSVEGYPINWFTNDVDYPNQSVKAFQQSILTLEGSARQLTADQILLKARRMFERLGTNNPHLIWYTDYHNWEMPHDIQGINLTVRPLNAAHRNNISLEEATIDRSDPDKTRLSVLVRNNHPDDQTPTMRVYTGGSLYTQTGAALSAGSEKTIDFDLGAAEKLNGIVTIEDRGLSYDDTLYFNIPEQPQVKILSIGSASKSVLQTIFDQRDFSFVQKDLNNLDYTNISDQNLIILDQVDKASNSFIIALKQHLSNGGGLILIPSLTESETTQRLLSELNIGNVRALINEPKKVVKINTSNLVFKNMFEQAVEGFQYPTIGKSLNIQSDAQSLLDFEQGLPFLLGKNEVYVFSGPITGPETNFDQSPLCVATLIQLARQTIVFPEPYYVTLGNTSLVEQPDKSPRKSLITGTLTGDQVIVLAKDELELIPRQKQAQDFIELDFSDIEFSPGHYLARRDKDPLAWLSFNHPRDESHGTFLTPELDSTPIKTSESMDLALRTINQTYEGKQLWLWFAIFALICFLAEMFILKQTT